MIYVFVGMTVLGLCLVLYHWLLFASYHVNLERLSGELSGRVSAGDFHAAQQSLRAMPRGSPFCRAAKRTLALAEQLGADLRDASARQKLQETFKAALDQQAKKVMRAKWFGGSGLVAALAGANLMFITEGETSMTWVAAAIMIVTLFLAALAFDRSEKEIKRSGQIGKQLIDELLDRETQR